MRTPNNNTVSPEKQSEQERSAKPGLSKGKIMFFSAILYLLFLSDFVCRVGVNTLYPLIQAELNLSDSQIGLLTSAVMLTMSIFVLPFSYIADKFSKKKAITLMAVFWSSATFLTGMAKSFPVVLLGRAGVGIGNSAYAPTSVSILTSWFDKKKWGKVLGVYNTAMTLGAALGAMVCGMLAESTGWRTTLFLIGGISLVISMLTLLIPEERQPSATEKANKKKVTLKETCQVLLSNKTLMNMCIGAGFMALITNALSGFVAIFYVREMGMTMVQVGSIMGTTGIIGAIAFPLGGAVLDFWYAKDKRARMWLPAICMLLMGGCYFIAFSMKLWPMMLVAGFISGFINTSIHTASQELVPIWNKSVSYGVYVTVTKVFGVIGPLVAGALSTRFGLVATLSGIQVCSIVVVLFLLVASRTYIKDFENSRALEAAQQN